MSLLVVKYVLMEIWQVRDSRGRRVGRCKEWAKVVGDEQVDARVMAMRHKDQPCVPKVHQATKPERVMTYRLVSPAAQLYCLRNPPPPPPPQGSAQCWRLHS